MVLLGRFWQESNIFSHIAVPNVSRRKNTGTPFFVVLGFWGGFCRHARKPRRVLFQIFISSRVYKYENTNYHVLSKTQKKWILRWFGVFLLRDERWRKKLQRGQKKATPHFGSENWQELRLPTSQVYTLENANSNFLSKPPHYCSTSTTVWYTQYVSFWSIHNQLKLLKLKKYDRWLLYCMAIFLLRNFECWIAESLRKKLKPRTVLYYATGRS